MSVTSSHLPVSQKDVVPILFGTRVVGQGERIARVAPEEGPSRGPPYNWLSKSRAERD